MRPLIKKEEMSAEAKQMWQIAQRSGSIEYSDEQVVFTLSDAEAEKCRFEITDMNNRMAECTVHTRNFTHGIRLHPPHLYKLENGIVYVKSGEDWVRWLPNMKENKKRLENRES